MIMLQVPSIVSHRSFFVAYVILYVFSVAIDPTLRPSPWFRLDAKVFVSQPPSWYEMF